MSTIKGPQYFWAAALLARPWVRTGEGAGKKLASRIRFLRHVELRGGNEINQNELALHTTGEWLGRWVVLRSFPEWPNLVSAAADGTRNLEQMGNVQNTKQSMMVQNVGCACHCRPSPVHRSPTSPSSSSASI